MQIPPLRERKEDIPAFAESFLQDANRELEKQVEGFDAETAAWMNRYKWPGNLRQMRNAIKRAVLFCKGRIVTIADLPEELTADAESMPEPPASPLLRKVNEKEQILDALRRARNNKSEAPVCWRSTGKPCTTSSSCTVSSYSEPDILPRIRFAEPIARSTRKDIRAGSAEEPLFSNSSRSAAVRSACN